MLARNLWTVIVVGLGMGCTPEPPVQPQGGNVQLGIREFVIDEQPDRVTVLGLDASGREIGRLDLVRGMFTLSPPFADDYDTQQVDGRKLTVTVKGQRMNWETAGYEPVLNMPAQPASRWAIAAFLRDPFVKPILDRWKIGFEALTPNTAYYSIGSVRGFDFESCDGQTSCGSASNGTINTCGAETAALSASRVTQDPVDVPGSDYQHVVFQCCPPQGAARPLPWFAIKACPTTGDDNTMCGTRTAGACKSCPEYPIGLNGGSCWTGDPEFSGDYTEDQQPIYHMFYGYSDTPSDSLLVNEAMYPGDSLNSWDGRFTLVYQWDGNLVLFYNGVGWLWQSGTAGSEPGVIYLQEAGNLVIYDAYPHAVWWSETSDPDASHLMVQSDGNVVLYDGFGNAVWQTYTCCY